MSERLAAFRANRERPAQTGQNNGLEMTPVQSNGGATHGNGVQNAGHAIPQFLDEVVSIQDSIDRYNDNVNRISEFHSRSINAVNDSAKKQDAAQAEALASETTDLGSSIKERIKKLQFSAGSGPDAQMRRNRVEHLRSKFMESLQNYQRVEQQYRQKSRQRIERQFKIVKPDATPEEVSRVTNDDSGGGDQIFAQAISSSTAYESSRAAYNEVRDRHQELRRLEGTLAELAQLFADMSELVAQQDETIDNIETSARKVEDETEAGVKYTDKAVEHAKSWRRKKWICFFICLIIAIIIAVVLAIELRPKHNNSNNSNSNTNSTS